jgi:hypothetical protein
MILSESRHNGRRVVVAELTEKGQQISLFESVGDRRRRKARRARPLAEARAWARRLLGEPSLARQAERMLWAVRLLR